MGTVGFGDRPGVGARAWAKQGGDVHAGRLLDLGVWERGWAWVRAIFTALGRISQTPRGASAEGLGDAKLGHQLVQQ